MKKLLISFIHKLYTKLPISCKNLVFVMVSKISYHSKSRNIKKLTMNFDRKEIRKTHQISKGVNIIGDIVRRSGIFREITYCARKFQDTKILFTINNLDLYGRYKNRDIFKENALPSELQLLVTDKLSYPTNIICCTPSNLAFLPISEYINHYNIAFVPCETSDIPDYMATSFAIFDEVWTISKFCQEAFSKMLKRNGIDIPVTVHSIADESMLEMDPEKLKKYDRKYFGLPEKRFLFYFIFDQASSVTRKNPKAVLEAFAKAFPEGGEDAPMLLIKMHKDGELKVAESIRNRVIIISKTLDDEEFIGLSNCCDCFVSLHRSEGYGLNLYEALKLGKPVIATNYSANTEFMTEKNFPGLCFLVDYKLIPISRGDYRAFHTNKSLVWAEADIDHAANLMKKVYKNVCIA